jgi:hypothetical protein
MGQGAVKKRKQAAKAKKGGTSTKEAIEKQLQLGGSSETALDSDSVHSAPNTKAAGKTVRWGGIVSDSGEFYEYPCPTTKSIKLLGLNTTHDSESNSGRPIRKATRALGTLLKQIAVDEASEDGLSLSDTSDTSLEDFTEEIAAVSIKKEPGADEMSDDGVIEVLAVKPIPKLKGKKASAKKQPEADGTPNDGKFPQLH